MITVTAVNGVTAQCAVTVDSSLRYIYTELSEYEIIAGEPFQLEVLYVPANTTDNRELMWMSSDTRIATVDANGVVTGEKPGTATITAISENGLMATCAVEVLVPMTAVELSTSTLEVDKGTTTTLTAAVLPANTTDDKTITWASSNTSVATVDQNGNVKAVRGGHAVITATSSTGIVSECKVKVLVELTELYLAKESYTLLKGKKELLSYWPYPSDASVGTDYTWTSTNESIVKVDKDGLMTATGVGTAVVTMTSSNGLSDTCKVTVKESSCSYSHEAMYEDIAKVVAYLKTNGKLSYTYNDSDGYVGSVEITYNEYTDCLNFRFYHILQNYEVSFNYDVTSMKQISQISILGEDQYSAIRADLTSTNFNSETYSTSTKLSFTGSYGSINATVANQLVRQAFAIWGNALLDTVKLPLCNIGFENYGKFICLHDGEEIMLVEKQASPEAEGYYYLICKKCFGDPIKCAIPQIDKIVLSETVYTYDGAAKEPEVHVVDVKGKTIASKWYTLTYENNVNAGTATATVVFHGERWEDAWFTGTLTANFTINKIPSSVKISDKNAVYNGSVQEIYADETSGSSGKVTYTYYTGRTYNKTGFGSYFKNNHYKGDCEEKWCNCEGLYTMCSEGNFDSVLSEDGNVIGDKFCLQWKVSETKNNCKKC